MLMHVKKRMACVFACDNMSDHNFVLGLKEALVFTRLFKDKVK